MVQADGESQGLGEVSPGTHGNHRESRIRKHRLIVLDEGIGGFVHCAVSADDCDLRLALVQCISYQSNGGEPPSGLHRFHLVDPRAQSRLHCRPSTTNFTPRCLRVHDDEHPQSSLRAVSIA